MRQPPPSFTFQSRPSAIHHPTPPLSLPPTLTSTLPPDLQESLQALWLTIPHAPFQNLEEIRLRVGQNSSLTVGGENFMLPITITPPKLFAILTQMCGGSLYAFSDSISQGYITLQGGVRVGVAGQATCEQGRVIGVRDITSLCIRIPHPAPQVGGEIYRLFWQMKASSGGMSGILIYAPPCVGKTTLLRGVVTLLAGGRDPLRVVVVDTRGELIFQDTTGLCLDVLTGYPRSLGVSIATRCMGAQVIACDEIGDRRDVASLLSAYHGGVPLLATAHGSSREELMERAGLKLLHDAGIFGAYVGITRDGRGDFFYHMQTREGQDIAL